MEGGKLAWGVFQTAILLLKYLYYASCVEYGEQVFVLFMKGLTAVSEIACGHRSFSAHFTCNYNFGWTSLTVQFLIVVNLRCSLRDHKLHGY